MSLRRALFATVAILLSLLPASAADAGNDGYAPSRLPTPARSLLTSGQDQVHFLTYNMGAGCNDPNLCSGPGEQRAFELYIIAAASPRMPMAIAVQEMCRHTGYNALASYFDDHLYLSHFYAERTGTSGRSVCGGTTSDYQFGVGVFWLGACWNNDCRHTFTYSSQSSGEARGYACARAAFPTYWACSTHLAAADATAALQADQYYSWTSVMDLSARVVAAGDFNVAPEATQDTEFENHFPPWREANCLFILAQCMTHEFRDPPDVGPYVQKKHDYIFSSMCRTHNGAVHFTNLSDHHVLQGYFSGSC